MEKRKARILILSLALIALLIAGTVVIKRVHEKKIYVQNRNTLRTLQIFSRDDNCTEQYVNRYQALRFVMRTAGLRNSTVEIFDNVKFAVPPILDVDKPGVRHGYICSGYFSNVIFGKDSGKNTFEPLETATVKNCAVFISRCLGNFSADEDELWEFAKSKEIIRESDRFYDAPNTELTPEIFCLLLVRMLDCDRYLYFAVANLDYIMDINDSIRFDVEGSITYREYAEVLNHKRRNRFSKSGSR